MQPDELKRAWQALERRIERDSTLNLQLLRERKLEQARSSLRPLALGQCLQGLFGLLFVALASLLWRTTPEAPAVIVAGICVHAYGVACIVSAGLVLAGIARVDYAAPVLSIQKQLARIRRSHALGGMVAGLPWWFLWVPLLMVLVGLVGGDLAARAPGMVAWGLGTGLVGLVGTLGILRWSRGRHRSRLADAMEDAITARSLRRAHGYLRELERFDRG